MRNIRIKASKKATTSKIASILPVAAVCLLMTCLLTACASSGLSKQSDNKKVTPNTPLVTNIYTADPSAHVFDGKLYIYPSHDTDTLYPSDNDGGSYQMNDYHVLSIDNFESSCKDLGVVLSLADIPWAEKQLWAPDAAYLNGKYYLYFPAKDKDGIFRIGAAVSDSPAGPFVPEESYIPGSFSIDPAVYVDDGEAYMFFGGIWGGQLERWETGTYDASAEGPSGSEPAMGPMVAKMTSDMLGFETTPEQIVILDQDGNPITADDEPRRFFEAVWVHKYDGHYYLSYSTGTTHYLVYAMSDNLLGPYTYQGTILDPVEGWTTHHSIVEFEGKWYLFYHDATLSDGVDSQRCVKYAELKYNEDGTIQQVKP